MIQNYGTWALTELKFLRGTNLITKLSNLMDFNMFVYKQKKTVNEASR